MADDKQEQKPDVNPAGQTKVGTPDSNGNSVGHQGTNHGVSIGRIVTNQR